MGLPPHMRRKKSSFLLFPRLHKTTMNKNFMFFVGWGYHGFFIDKSDKTSCFGENSEGQLSTGEDVIYYMVPKIVDFFNNHEILNICTGLMFSIFQTKLGILSSGCGKNGATSLGDQNMRNVAEKVLFRDNEDVDVVKISCGAYSSFYLSSLGIAYASGENHKGMLCLGDNNDRFVAEKIYALKEKIVDIVSGYRYVIFRGKRGRIFCGGEIQGLIPNRPTPLCLPTELSFFKERDIQVTSIIPGYSSVFFQCDNWVYTAGENTHGQWGNGNYDKDTSSYAQPVLSKTISNVSLCTAGELNLVWKGADGKFYGTGNTEICQLGMRATWLQGTTRLAIPTEIPIPSTIREKICQVCAMFGATYYITRDGETIYGSGANPSGQMFDEDEDLIHAKVTLLLSGLNLKEMPKQQKHIISLNVELVKERLEFVLSRHTDLKIQFNDTALEILSIILNPESRRFESIKDGKMEVNRNLHTTVFDCDLLHSIVLGADVQNQLDENVQNYLDLYRFFNSMSMRKRELVLLKSIGRIKSLRKLVKLFVLAYEQLEQQLSNRDGDVHQMLERQNVDEISFESNFTLSVFNTLARRGEGEIRKEATLVKILEKLNVWSDLIRFSIRPLEKLARFEDLQKEATFQELFHEHLKVLFRHRNRNRCGNYVVVSADEKEIAIHKEVLCVQSDYFFKVIRFGGRETRKDGYLLLERLNYKELFIIVEFCYTNEVNIVESGEGLVLLMNVLEEIIPYLEGSLQAKVEQKILKIAKSQIEKGYFLEDGLVKIGHYLSSTNRTLPNDVKKKFVNEWGKSVEKEKLKEVIERSALKLLEAKKEAEKVELEQKVNSLSEEVEQRFGKVENEVREVKASIVEMRSSIAEILKILQKGDNDNEGEGGRKRKTGGEGGNTDGKKKRKKK